MKSHFILITAVLATTAGLGASSNALADSTETGVKLGDHPAVVVARTQAKRGIDTNKFIVAHPARLQLLAASPTATPATHTASAGR